MSSGECLCGAVSFSVEFPSKWVAHCHCTICQRAHGAAFVTWVSLETSQLEIHDEQHALNWFESSDRSERGFCSKCGSHLFFRAEGLKNETHVVRANFTGEVDSNPQAHAFYDTKVDWVDVLDDLHKIPKPE